MQIHGTEALDNRLQRCHFPNNHLHILRGILNRLYAVLAQADHAVSEPDKRDEARTDGQWIRHAMSLDSRGPTPVGIKVDVPSMDVKVRFSFSSRVRLGS